MILKDFLKHYSDPEFLDYEVVIMKENTNFGSEEIIGLATNIESSMIDKNKKAIILLDSYTHNELLKTGLTPKG